MEKQKNLPHLRFPEFKGTWNKKKFGEVTYKVGKKNKDKIKYPIYSINNKEGFLPQSDQFEGMDSNDRGYDISLYKIIEEKTFAYNPARINVGSIGYSAQLNNVIISSLYVCFKTTELIDDFFLLHYLKTKNFNKSVLSSVEGGVRNYLFYENFASIKVYLPTIDEQKRIASFLTVLDKKIAQLKQKKTLLEQYKKGVMQKIFSQELRFKDENGKEFPKWEKKRLNKIAEIYDGTHQTPTYLEEGIPFYSVEHVTANNFQDTKYISKEVFEKENKRVKLEKGDILMTRIGDIGTSRLINWDVNASFYVSLALIKQSTKYNSEYLNQYISTRDFQSELWKRTIHVAFPQKINLGEIGDCFVVLPSKEEQTQIANFLTAIDEKINRTENQIQQTQEYKKVLLQNMFC